MADSSDLVKVENGGTKIEFATEASGGGPDSYSSIGCISGDFNLNDSRANNAGAGGGNESWCEMTDVSTGDIVQPDLGERTVQMTFTVEMVPNSTDQSDLYDLYTNKTEFYMKATYSDDNSPTNTVVRDTKGYLSQWNEIVSGTTNTPATIAAQFEIEGFKPESGGWT